MPEGAARPGIRTGRVGLEQGAHHLLAQQPAGLGQRRPGRGDGARLDGQPRHREHPGQDLVIAAVKQHPGQHAQRGDLRSQRPVQPVPVISLRGRAGNRAIGQQSRDQAFPAQLTRPVLPEPRPGRRPRQQHARDRGPVIIMTSGNNRRVHDGHGRLSRQRSSSVRR
jgi:hypothetical protein